MRAKHVLTCGLVAAFALPGGTATALGLGRLTVESALGQPLSARIELLPASKDELDSLSAKVADPTLYRQNNLPYQGALSRARITLERGPGETAWLRVTSPVSVNEPYLDLLVEVNWSAGRVVRDYTFLLDPPGATAVAQVDPVTPARTGAPAVRSPAPGTGLAARSPAPGAAAPVAPAGERSAEGTYQVKRGDTLSKIAAQYKPETVTLEQMLVALFRSNQDAFDNGNMNRLRLGTILTIPNAVEVSTTQSSEATKTVRMQAADWRGYRDRVAATVPSADEGGGRTAGGRIGTAVVERVPAVRPGSDQLQVSKEARTGKAAGVSETAIARDAQMREAQARIAELERTLKDLQRAVELKNQTLAQLQAQADTPAKGRTAPTVSTSTPSSAASPPPAMAPRTGTPAAPPAVTTSPFPVAPATAPSSPPAAAPRADAPSVAAAPPTPSTTPSATTPSGTTPPAVKPPAASPSMATPPATLPSTATTSPATTPPSAEPPKAPVAVTTPSSSATTATTGESPKIAAPTPKAVPKPAPKEAPGFFEEFFGSTPLWAIGVGALALLGAIAALVAARRRKTTKFEDSIISGTDIKTNTVFGSTGGGVVNTGDNSLASDFSREGLGNIDTDEVDPIAEAEVYLAYGRDAQAEEILKDALKKDSQRQEIYLKLLEIHAQHNKPSAFETVASELYAVSHGQGEVWHKAVMLGRQLDPNNPMFTDGGAAAGMPERDTGTFTVAPSRGSEPPPIFGGAGSNLDLQMDEEISVSPTSGARPKSPADILAGAKSEIEKTAKISLAAENVPADRTATAAALGVAGAAGAASVADRSGAKAVERPAIDSPVPAADAGKRRTSSADKYEFDFMLDEAEKPAPMKPRGEPALEMSTASAGPASQLARPAAALELDKLDLSFDPDRSPFEDPTPSVLDGQWHDAATKLDLARAYQEMGDVEGAREILQEVMHEGDDQQKTEAQALLAKL
ncbi:MAG: FimV/HubP family polar landmark protein [Casimicrobiaceae bacterium]